VCHAAAFSPPPPPLTAPVTIAWFLFSRALASACTTWEHSSGTAAALLQYINLGHGNRNNPLSVLQQSWYAKESLAVSRSLLLLLLLLLLHKHRHAWHILSSHLTMTAGELSLHCCLRPPNSSVHTPGGLDQAGPTGHLRKGTWYQGCCPIGPFWPMAVTCLSNPLGSHCSQC
jgi:hypothetical protein